MTDQLELLPQQVSAQSNANPCVRAFGRGPEGQKCKGCLYLLAKRMSKTYYKCEHRKITAGPATDHRVRWDACAKYVTGKTCPTCGGCGWIATRPIAIGDVYKPPPRCDECVGKGRVPA